MSPGWWQKLLPGAGTDMSIHPPLKNGSAAGQGAKKWRKPPLRPRIGGQDLRVFLKSAPLAG